MPSFRRELLFSLVIRALCVLLFFVDIAGVPEASSGIRSRALVTRGGQLPGAHPPDR